MGVFFVSWALWEEMTFVLACAIVVVFLIGLFKLWRTSRQVRRQEVIDEEKRARLTEMRKVGMSSPTGLSATGGRKQRSSEIPFGVRAIQTGIEVDGIWISRPTTASRSSSKSKLGLGASQLNDKIEKSEKSEKSDKGDKNAKEANDKSEKRPYSRPGSQQQQQGGAASTFLDTHSNLSTPLPQISEDDATVTTQMLVATAMTTTIPSHHHQHQHQRGALNEESLRRLEGAYLPTGYRGTATSSPQLNTYIPSSNFSHMSSPSASSLQRQSNYAAAAAGGPASRHLYLAPQLQHQRASTASADSLTSMSAGGGGLVGGGLSSRSNRSNRSNRSTSSRSSTSSASRHPTSDKLLHHSHAHHQQRQAAGPLPPTSPVRLSATGYNVSVPSSQTPSQSFPGDAFANRATRKVNPAFEVLPAGTFGHGAGTASVLPYTDEDEEETVLDSRRTSGGRNKLRRASQTTPQWSS
ncbi:hypothetical protein SCUCBS95973_002138 [Sporothrix curviconia]|uniref:Membrane-associated protein n=1 Tax=Sporothrix curviconia TaxID=1260050 RepID=A0ABP0B4K7_9PEZI